MMDARSLRTPTDTRHWILEDHLCQDCGGRILKCVKGGGPTGGGNPIFKCSCCGKEKSGMTPDVLCWCGFHHRMNHATPYRCLPFSLIKERPELEQKFRACGCDPQRGEVGIILEKGN